jgi:hypothetical protein
MATTFRLSVSRSLHLESRVQGQVFLPLQPVTDKPRPLTPCLSKSEQPFLLGGSILFAARAYTICADVFLPSIWR